MLYLTEQGSKLLKESKRLIVEKEGEILLEVPAIKVERVLIFGYVQLSTQAMEFLLREGIPTSFLSMTGRLKGILEPMRSKNIPLRMQQYERAQNMDFRLRLSKAIVRGKLRNQKRLIQRFAHNHPAIDFTEDLRNIGLMLKAVEHRQGLQALLGVEGRATAIYFTAYSRLFRGELDFRERTQRPPKSPVNSLLSLGYTVLTNEYLSLVSAVGLDPYLGFYHGISYGRPSLALDLVEELRHPVVDMLVLDLIGRGILKKGDFQEEDEGFYLTQKGRKDFFTQYERRMMKEFRDYETGAVTTIRKVVMRQVYRMVHAIAKDEDYKPFLIG